MEAAAGWLAGLLAPWVDLYSSTSWLEVVISFLHVGALVAAGGMAFALDRAVLHGKRHGRSRRTELASELESAHRAVVVGLGVVVLSGVALTAADPETYLVSWVFWGKMVVVLLLLANGWFLKRAGERIATDPEDGVAVRRLRGAALRSVGLWALAVLAGVALTVSA